MILLFSCFSRCTWWERHDISTCVEVTYALEKWGFTTEVYWTNIQDRVAWANERIVASALCCLHLQPTDLNDSLREGGGGLINQLERIATWGFYKFDGARNYPCMALAILMSKLTLCCREELEGLDVIHHSTKGVNVWAAQHSSW